MSSSGRFPAARYLFFGGKGGVGKTTAAAATAFYLLETLTGSPGDILLFSTDPAHSLSDCLDRAVGNREATIARRGRIRLLAYEIDAPGAFEEFKSRHRAALAHIAHSGTILDESDIEQLLNLALPGMDEVMALFELSEWEKSGRYERVVVDTAPSGHTVRLLELPDLLAGWSAALSGLMDKERYLAARFGGGKAAAGQDVDRFFRELSERVERVRDVLFDPSRSAFCLITTPEIMSVEESARYLQFLKRHRVPVTDLIVNRVEQGHPGCAYCQARAAQQEQGQGSISRRFKGLRRHHLPLFYEEMRGPPMLRRVGRILWGEAADVTRPRRQRKSQFKVSLGSEAFPLQRRKLLIFGGKGGVGKTTAAAAAALRLAGEHPGTRFLLLSTDPAHSLSDSFQTRIGELKKSVAARSNLDATEINAPARFEELKKQYREWADRVFDQLTGDSQLQVQFERQALHNLVEVAPPGLDEIMALGAIINLLKKRVYGGIILDTAPTGHLVRLLELPEVALSWVQMLMRLLLKYRALFEGGEIAEKLISLSRSIKGVMSLLAHPQHCEFVGIATPEGMSLGETQRLAKVLDRLRIPLHKILINRLVPAGAAQNCAFCHSRLWAQQRAILKFAAEKDPRLELYAAPEQAAEIRGRKALERHAAAWRSLQLDSERRKQAETRGGTR